MKRVHFLYSAAAAIFFVLIFPALQMKMYVLNDLINFHIPMRIFYQDCLSSGENFLWFSNISCGYYIHGEGQVGMFHPLHLFLYSFLPLQWAFNLETFIHYPFMFIGMYLFLLRLSTSREGALLGALIFTFCGFNLYHFIHINSVAVISHLPWLLLMINMIATQTKKTVPIVAIAMLTSSQILLGHWQSMWFCVFAEMFYTLTLISLLKRRVFLLLLGKVLALLIGAIQLLPTWDVLSLSLRSDVSQAYSAIGSARWSDLGLLVAPFAPLAPEGVIVRHTLGLFGNGHEFALYCGTTTLILIVWLCMRFKHLPLQQKKIAITFFILMFTALMMAMGKNGFLYSLQSYAPFISKFRYPVRYIVIVHFSMAVLAALAFVDLKTVVEEETPLPLAKLLPMMSILIVSCLVAIWALKLPYNAEGDYSQSIILGPSFALIATLLILCSLKVSKRFLPAVIVFLAFELGFGGITYLQVISPKTLDEIKTTVHGDNSYRWEIAGNVNLYAAQGLRCVNGYTGFKFKQILPRDSKKYKQLAGVNVYHIPRYDKYTNIQGALPRIRFVNKVIVSQNIQKDILQTNITDTALVASPLSLDNKGKLGNAKISKETAGNIKIAVTTPTKQLLIISERFHSGWKVKIDGKPSEVITVYGEFMGCVVSEQNKQVEFSFQPQSYIYGKWITWLGLVLTFLVVFLLRKYSA